MRILITPGLIGNRGFLMGEWMADTPYFDLCDRCKAMEAWFKCECGRGLCGECFYYHCDCED